MGAGMRAANPLLGPESLGGRFVPGHEDREGGLHVRVKARQVGGARHRNVRVGGWGSCDGEWRRPPLVIR
jgi:hypothetical protein